MDIPNLAILTALAVFLLALHVAGAIIVLRVLRTAAHHAARLEELAGLEDELLEHERRRSEIVALATAPAAEAALSESAAAQALKAMFGQQG
jgi:hypothetical protein